MKSLSDSIDALYAAFADVPKPAKIEGCPCCIDQKEIDALLSKPLRTITGDELAGYSSSAFLTVGDMADYLYLLPRIVEISSIESGWWPDVEITGRAIGTTNPMGWPGHRRQALLDFLHATLQAAIENEAGWTIDEWICAIGKTGLDLAPFLQQVETSPKALLAYYERNSKKLVGGKLGNAFWEKTDAGYQHVIQWFESPRITVMISKAYGLS